MAGGFGTAGEVDGDICASVDGRSDSRDSDDIVVGVSEGKASGAFVVSSSGGKDT